MTPVLTVGVDATPGESKNPVGFPPDIITQTLAILAVKRAGKSNAAVVIAEEMFRAGLPWVAIDPKGDWWGLRAGRDGAPGLAVLVLGGEHGDVPLEPSSGRVVAEFVVEQRLTCVLDVSEFSRADQRRFLTDFAERLYKLNREPLHVFCEEADEYIPQRVMAEMARLVGAFETLVKRGGFRGIGITLITQRSASLNKDVLTQIETLIVLRTPSPQDRKAILDWVQTHAVGKEAVDQLPGLENGEAWVFSPQWLHVAGVRIKFRRRTTFDSGATPEVGAIRAPAVLADVDITALREAMAATIERAQAEDPTVLHRRIKELERLLTKRPKDEMPAPEIVEVNVEVPVISAEDRESLARLVRDAGAAASQLQAASHSLALVLEKRWGNLPRPVERALVKGGRPSAADVAPLPIPGGNGAIKPKSTLTAGVPGDREQRLLDAIAWWQDIGIDAPTRIQISLIAAFGIGGSFNGALAILLQAGLVEYPGSGTVRLTAEGRGRVRPMGIAATQEAFLERIFAKLHAHDVAILKALIHRFPISRQELSTLTGHRIGGTFNHALSRLEKLGLVAYPGPGLVQATDVLFPFVKV